MEKIGDQVRLHPLFGALKPRGSSSGVEATVFSDPISMREYSEAAVMLTVNEVSSVTARNKVEAKILGGTTTYASPTAYSSIASSFTVCASGATQTKLHFARITISGTATKAAAQTIIIDGTTFTMSATADSSIVVHTTNCSLAVAKLATCIQGMCTHLNATYYSAGVTTGPAHVEIWSRDGDRTFNVTSTSVYPGASADGLGLSFSRSAMYEFKAEDLYAASTVGYTHFVVRVNTTGTVHDVEGVAVLGDARYRPNIVIARGQMGTVSTAYSS